jgi:hypothetical protein
MSLAAGALSKNLVGSTTANLTSAAATGGTGPYTYQWYRSTTSGFTPGAGNILTGQTGLTLADSGLLPSTTYYYEVIATDTGNSNVTVDSSQLSVGTQPALTPNQFAQQQLVGIIDLKLGSTNVIAVQVAPTASGAGVPIYPGQGVKIVATTTGGIPQVQAVSAKGDPCIGFARFNQKDLQYGVGQMLEIAMWGSVIWLYATGAVTQFAEACLDSTFVGGVQATGSTATIVGTFIDGASAAGLVRVLLIPNATFATA